MQVAEYNDGLVEDFFLFPFLSLPSHPTSRNISLICRQEQHFLNLFTFML